MSRLLRMTSLGTKLALATVGVLSVISVLLYLQLTSREQRNHQPIAVAGRLLAGRTGGGHCHQAGAKAVELGATAWFRIGHSWVTRAYEERRPVRAGLRPEGCPVREAARLPVVKPAGAEAVPGPAG